MYQFVQPGPNFDMKYIRLFRLLEKTRFVYILLNVFVLNFFAGWRANYNKIVENVNVLQAETAALLERCSCGISRVQRVVIGGSVLLSPGFVRR